MKDFRKFCAKMSLRWILLVVVNMLLVQHTPQALATPTTTYGGEKQMTTPVLLAATEQNSDDNRKVETTQTSNISQEELPLISSTFQAIEATAGATATTTATATDTQMNSQPNIETHSQESPALLGISSTELQTPAMTTTTLASSNAPATTTTNNGNAKQLQEKNDKSFVEKQVIEEDKQKLAKEDEDEKVEQQNNNEHLKSVAIEIQQQQEIRATATESQTQQQEQQQYILTTEMPSLTETEMHKQATGNAQASNTDNNILHTITTAATANKNTPLLTTATPTTTDDTVMDNSDIITDDLKLPDTEIIIDAIQLNTATIAAKPKEAATTFAPHNAEVNDKQKALEDFNPLIQEANNKLLQERTIFTPKHGEEQEEWKQNLMPNEVDDYDNNKIATKYGNQPYEHNINWSPYLHPATPVVDFTGKVLQEEDGAITEIEEKFRLKEFATEIGDKLEETTENNVELLTTEAGLRATSTKLPLAVNHEKPLAYTNSNNRRYSQTPMKTSNIAVLRPMGFIERRVKKSFDFPMHRIASDAGHAMQHFDFANTKFSSNINEPMQHLSNVGDAAAIAVNQGHDTEMAALHVPRLQPEFSTTKFYNSKELYNEMLQHKNKQFQQQHQQQLQQNDKDHVNTLKANVAGAGVDVVTAASPSLALNSFAVLHSPKIAKLEELHEQREPQKSLAIKRVTVQATKHKENPIQDGVISSFSSSPSESLAYSTTSSTTTTTEITSSTTTTESNAGAAAAVAAPTKKFHKELKKAKLLIKTMMPNKPSVETNTNSAKITNYSPAAASIESQSIGTTATLASATSPKTPAASVKSSTEQIAAAAAATSSFYGNNPQSLTTVKPLEMYKPESRSNTLTSSSSTKLVAATYSSSLKTGGKTTTSSSSPSSVVAAAPSPPLSSSSSSSLVSSVAASSASSATSSSTTTRPTAVSTNPTKSPLKPIVRPRILSRLQEKINSLECEIQNVPEDSHLWRGNETHELLLPIMTPENCKTDKDCTAMMVSWEGEAEIQSGDILIVEINDALLSPKDVNLTTSSHNTQVYQVTRSGHEHCDVTEGILLDITPLIVDGRKLVTLYDKDLTEGVNLLIVVSELWGSQCVRLKVTTKTENCGENADCSGKGVCFSNTDMEEYECQCCSGFAGPHCEEIDACTPSPCTNNGICVDLSQGHEGNSYQCLCPYGYTGKNCQYELDPCNPAECMNGGSCVGNSTHFRCECSPGYTGPLCQHSLNECESSPCIHGICVDQEDGFRCFCQPGFAGELCNFEYNECESNPCQNGGECIDHIGSFECHCSKGYTGNRCHIKVDFCANKPCPEGRRCIDHGNDYSCECQGGHNGPDCNDMQRTQCNVNPCTHGGTCWSSGDSFYCACRPGYTGTMCEDEFVVETVVSSSEFMVDDTSARNFNDKSFGSSVVLKSPIELHNAYTAAIVLALVIFFVALYLTICHCKVNQTYRKFSTRTYGFLPILGFRWRTKQATSKISRHWLSGKGLAVGGANAMRNTGAATNSSLTSSQRNNVGQLPTANASSSGHQQQQQHQVGQLNERPFQRHLAMNLENDMYYTVDFSENSQHSPLIQ